MLREGQRIEHNRFGLGTIISMEGNATDRKAKINFDLHGEKTLLLQYAKIRFPKEK
jgi:DNA helicase-2/ATP-dependent DNA helicase PcrA